MRAFSSSRGASPAMAATRLAHPTPSRLSCQLSHAPAYSSNSTMSISFGSAASVRRESAARPSRRVTVMARPMVRLTGRLVARSSGDRQGVPDCLGDGNDKDICVLRVMRPSVFKLGRVNVPGDLAKVLDPDIDEKVKSAITINAAASHPKNSLPAQCNLGHRQKKAGASERFFDGLTAYFRANGVEPDLDLVLMSSVAPAAASSSSSGGGATGRTADRPQLSIRVIRDGDLPAATLYNLRREMGKGQAWVGRRADLPTFIAWAARQPLPEGWDSPASGGAAGAVPLQRRKPEPQPKGAPKPERPKEAEERIQRRREQQQRVIKEGSDRLLAAGLSEEDVKAVAAWRAAAHNRRVVRMLTERAFRCGKVNVPSELVGLFCPPWTPGVKPEPVQVPAHVVSYGELLPYVMFRGSPRARHGGYVEWTMQGLGGWLKGSSGTTGDALLVWVEEEEQEEGKVKERLHLHLLKMAADVSGALMEELGSSA